MVEMRPDLAPKAVERIKLLAREGVYNGLQFHRVIELYVAQTGNPNNKDGGTSGYPNLAPEFSARLPADTDWTRVTHEGGGTSGFLGTMPIIARASDTHLEAWGA